MKLKYDKRNIKSRCVVCNRNIGWSKLRYRARGNYCAVCNARSAKIANCKIFIQNLVAFIRTTAEQNPERVSILKAHLRRKQQHLETLKQEAPQYIDFEIKVIHR